MKHLIVVLAALTLIFGSALRANAGTVFTDQALFNAAVAARSLNVAWSENFEGFASGGNFGVLSIAGGNAQVSTMGGGASITSFGPTGKAWFQPPGSNASPKIAGLGGASLGVSALSFNFGDQMDGHWIFNGTLEIKTSPVFPGSSTSFATSNFVGWVGTGSETLNFAQYDQTNFVTLDNITAFNATPEPATLTLLAIGAAGMAGYAWRRRTRAAP